MRTAIIERKTRETEILASVDLDGTGLYDVDTGIGFLDHMLESFSRHSSIDLKVRAQGDLHVDFHHTTEDTAIAIGQAIRRALGDFAGIRRFGSILMPMDETLTQVAVDISNRPYLIWKVQFARPKIGEMDTELFREWFQALAQNAGVCLHIENLYGENNHHIVESCFKGLARALRAAIDGGAIGRPIRLRLAHRDTRALRTGGFAAHLPARPGARHRVQQRDRPACAPAG